MILLTKKPKNTHHVSRISPEVIIRLIITLMNMSHVIFTFTPVNYSRSCDWSFFPHVDDNFHSSCLHQL